MKIELRNVRHSATLSQETNAFTATIHVDGAKAGHAENHGHGGPTSVSPRELERKITAWAKTLPHANIYEGTEEEPVMREQDAESIIDRLLTDHLIAGDVRKRLAKRVLYTRRDKPGIFETRALTAAQKAQVLSSPDVRSKWNVQAFLNEMPLDEAVAAYRKG